MEDLVSMTVAGVPSYIQFIWLFGVEKNMGIFEWFSCSDQKQINRLLIQETWETGTVDFMGFEACIYGDPSNKNPTGPNE